jgi:cysteine desulfurase
MPYFDHFATTPVRPEVQEKMLEITQNAIGNPSSVHASGRAARAAIEEARSEIADAIGAQSQEIIFTGGGTEANNMVLWSLIRKIKKHVVTTKVEHPAVLKVLKELGEIGVTHSAINVNPSGMVNPHDISSAIQDDTGLISIILGNNEVGTIQPIKDISLIAQNGGIPHHSDAVQALGKIPIDVKDLGVDFMSFASHKCYGPKGVGALFAKDGTDLHPLIIGGKQERNLRAGTENVAGIAGFGLAVRLAKESLAETRQHLKTLADQFRNGVSEICNDAVFNGDSHQLPGIVSVSFPQMTSDKMMIHLDREAMEVSAGSACGSGDIKPSSVLEAMGVEESLNLSTLRMSFGKDNTSAEVNNLVRTIGQILNGAE